MNSVTVAHSYTQSPEVYTSCTDRIRGKTPSQSTIPYIGVAGVAKNPKSGIRGRLQSHRKHRTDWSHYSFFEVHDNVTREEILELESLFLAIFRHDPRIQLENKQKGSTSLYKLRGKQAWSDVL